MRLNKLNQVLAGEQVTDVVRVASYRSDLFGRAFIDGLQEVLNIIDRIADALDFSVPPLQALALRAGVLLENGYSQSIRSS